MSVRLRRREKSFEAARAKKVVEKRAFHRGKWRCRVNPLRSSRSSACFQTATLLKSANQTVG
jgi:hypothetical protein